MDVSDLNFIAIVFVIVGGAVYDIVDAIVNDIGVACCYGQGMGMVLANYLFSIKILLAALASICASRHTKLMQVLLQFHLDKIT